MEFMSRPTLKLRDKPDSFRVKNREFFCTPFSKFLLTFYHTVNNTEGLKSKSKQCINLS